MFNPRIWLERVARFFHLESWFRLLMLCVLVGVVAGAGAIAFEAALNAVHFYVLEGFLFKFDNESNERWFFLLVPTLGGALAGFVALAFAPEATGHGTDSVIRAFHREKGEIRARVPLIKSICSLLTIGSGGSAGKEGPIAQIGAGFGSALGSLLRLSIRDRRLLMLAGVAGGIGAIFKAPLGGALFAAEVLYRDPDFEHDAVIPGVISSVTAYSVFTAVYGHSKILDVSGAGKPLTYPSPGGHPLMELIHYGILSVLCALVAWLLIQMLMYFQERFFKRLPVPAPLKPGLGGLMLGGLTLIFVYSVASEHFGNGAGAPGTAKAEYIMGGGYRYLQSIANAALDPKMYSTWDAMKVAGFLLAVAMTKIVATSFTLGSGGSGGVLFPALFLGGVTGGAYAQFIRALSGFSWFPEKLVLPPNARAGMILVGMSGVFAAATKTPIASLVMVSEITGSYGLVVPLMICCASAYVLSHSFTISLEQVRGIADSPAHRGDFLLDILEGITVQDAMAGRAVPDTIPASMPFAQVLERIKQSSASSFPIVDDSGYLIGVFSLSDIRQILNERAVGQLIVAGDLGTPDTTSVHLETKLDEALRLFTRKNVDEIPVVVSDSLENSASRTRVSKIVKIPRGPVGTARVIGMLSRRDLISAYHKRLSEIKEIGARESHGSNVFTVEEIPLEENKVKTVLRPARPPSSAANPGLEMFEEPPER